MIKHIRRLLTTTLAIIAIATVPVSAQARTEDSTAAKSSQQWAHVMPQGIMSALEKGNVTGLSQSIGQTIELRLPNGSGVYSKKQAEMILSDFFATHKSVSYRIDHEESAGVATLTIGILQTTVGSLRLSILSQQTNGSFQIKQFRIEEQK